MKFNKVRTIIAGLIVGLLLMITPLKGYAQPIGVNPFAGSYFQPNFGINLGTFFNHQDLMLDFGVGYEELGYDFSVTLNGAFRPFYNRGKIEVDDQYFYQVKHKAIQFTIDLEKRLYFLQFLNYNKLGIYVGVKAGYAWDTYKGFSKMQNNQFVFLPNAGLSWQFTKMSRLSVGYLFQYNNHFAVPHMANIKLSLYFNNDKEN